MPNVHPFTLNYVHKKVELSTMAGILPKKQNNSDYKY